MLYESVPQGQSALTFLPCREGVKPWRIGLNDEAVITATMETSHGENPFQFSPSFNDHRPSRNNQCDNQEERALGNRLGKSP